MTAFERALRKLIEAEIEDQKQVLSLGLAIQDIAQYREAVGRIAGLRMTLELCQTAHDEVEKSR